MVRRAGLAAAALMLAAACGAATPTATTEDVVADVPMVDGERYRYELVDADGDLIGHGELSTRLEGSRWVLEQRYQGVAEAGETPSTDFTTLAVDAATLKPFGGLREATRVNDDGEAEGESYDWGYLEGSGADRLESSRNRDGDVDEGELRLREHYYDNESSLWLWRALDFDVELDLNYVSVNALDRTQQTVNLRAPAVETIEVPAGTFETWRLIVRNGRAVRSAWVNVDAPHQVVQWDNGDVVFRLESSELPQ